jgi:3-hydroxyacyl-CoA dehydrogenase/enoyl-CoA hydratase/3-hydroxybutyryl-CoA epimerase
VGLTTACDLILTGRRLDGRRAKKIGLVDEVVPEAYLERETLRRVWEAAARPRFRPQRKRGAVAGVVESVPPLRRFVLGRARKQTAAKVDPAAYPAPFRALECIDAAFALPLPEGLDLEARMLGDLVPTRTAKNLIWLFKSQTALKREAPGHASARKVRRAAVLGAGIMGGGISQLVADRDIPVRLKDIRYDAILTALRTARKVWAGQIARKRISPREARQRMGFLSPTLDDSGMGHVDLVVEAVVEELAVKQKVLAGAEAVLPERAVFASNTSTLPITDIAARALRPERVVGMHFFNPVHRMPLVEVIAGQRSSPEAVATVHAFAIDLGKTPVVVRDSPGFLVNRILMVYLNEAMRLHGEGVGIAPLDRAMTAFGMPMGPFALLDQVGLDVARHAARVLEGAFGKRIGASSPLLDAMVESGRLGAKNGKGFYRYRNGERGDVDPSIAKLVAGGAAREVPVETLQERMVLAMVNEATVCLEDGVVEGPRDVDVAMVLGTGFPPFRGGLLRHADEIGVPILVDRLSRLADAHGERFRPSAALHEMVREERKFYPAG